MFYSDYLRCAIDANQRKEIICRAIRRLRNKQKSINFTGIAFRGVSGALIAPSIADRLSCGLIIVRKKDGSHSSCEVEGNLTDRYIIVDDFVHTGNTMIEIVNKIKHYNPHSVCVGVYLYYAIDISTGWFRSKEHMVNKIREWTQNDTAQVWLGTPHNK